MLAPTTIFNTAVSFLTNTNLQHYSGEQHLSYFSQIVVRHLEHVRLGRRSASAPWPPIIRGLRGDTHMGNFYLDMWRVVVYVFLPASLLDGRAADGRRHADDASTAAPRSPTRRDRARWARTTTASRKPQMIARGPVAAIMPIKHLGTNGGGFFGANSAHPVREPQRLDQLPRRASTS